MGDKSFPLGVTYGDSSFIPEVNGGARKALESVEPDLPCWSFGPLDKCVPAPGSL